jgi:hypothetical protein
MNRVVRFIDYCDLIWVGDLCYPISSRACGMERMTTSQLAV